MGLPERGIALTLSQYTSVALWIRKWSSNRRLRSQQDSETTFATSLYSASALDQDKVGWCLLDQEIKLSPRKTQCPEVDRPVSGHPPQSASVYETRLITEDLYKCKPKLRVPFM